MAEKAPKKVRKGAVPFTHNIHHINPLTDNQLHAFREFEQGQNLVLHGYAGTGKTFIALYLALKAVMDHGSPYKQILIVRSAVATQDIGFLPGTYEEKIAPYEEPYDSICDELFKVKNVYDELKERGFITFMPISFIRGISFHNSIIIMDEAQNATFHQLDSVITRLGDNSRIMVCGDFTQSDLHKKQDKQGINDFMGILESLDDFTHIEFGEQDIVRSDVVKRYIIAKHRKGFQ